MNHQSKATNLPSSDGSSYRVVKRSRHFSGARGGGQGYQPERTHIKTAPSAAGGSHATSWKEWTPRGRMGYMRSMDHQLQGINAETDSTTKSDLNRQI